MNERWVVDASPLISLGAIDRLDLLTALAEDVVVPDVVAREVLRIEGDASRAFAQASLRTESVQPDDIVTRWGLGSGETAVLSFAKHGGYVALIDDLAARRCASVLGIPARGTLGVVLLAKQRGVIPSAGQLLGQLEAAGRSASRQPLPPLVEPPFDDPAGELLNGITIRLTAVALPDADTEDHRVARSG